MLLQKVPKYIHKNPVRRFWYEFFSPYMHSFNLSFDTFCINVNSVGLEQKHT